MSPDMSGLLLSLILHSLSDYPIDKHSSQQSISNNTSTAFQKRILRGSLPTEITVCTYLKAKPMLAIKTGDYPTRPIIGTEYSRLNRQIPVNQFVI